MPYPSRTQVEEKRAVGRVVGLDQLHGGRGVQLRAEAPRIAPVDDGAVSAAADADVAVQVEAGWASVVGTRA